jgi:prevent-host-death family protein
MRQVPVTELKDRLSQYLRLVKAGETIEITERSVAVAFLTRRPLSGAAGSAALERMLRDGLIAAPARAPDVESIERPPVACAGDVVAALVEVRGDR